MGKLYFRVASDWEEVVKLRNEIEKLKQTLLSMDKNRMPSAVAALEVQLGTARQKMDGLIASAAKAGAVMENDLKKKIFDSSQAVNTLTEKIIAQKAVMKDTEADVKRLGEAYRTALKNNPMSASGKLADYTSAKKALDEDKASLFGLTQEQAKARLSTKKLRDEYSLYKDDSAKVISANEDITGSMKEFILTIAGADAIKDFISKVIDISGNFQKMEAVLTNSLGSASKAKEAMDMLSDFGAKTPFQVDELTSAYVKLANQGFTPTMEQMRKLGDLASSTGKSFDQLTEAIIDAQVGENERLKEFGIRASKNGDSIAYTFKEQETTVKNTASAIREYILSLGDLEGVTGANEKISATFVGRLSNIQDELTNQFKNFGEQFSSELSGGINFVAVLVDNLNKIIPVIGGLVAAYGAYKAAVLAVSAAHKAGALYENIRLIGMMRKELGLATAAQQAFNTASKANIYAALLSVLIGIGTAVYMFTKNTNEATDAQKRLSDASVELNTEIGKETKIAKDLFDKLKNAKQGTKEYSDAKQKILDDYGKYLSGMNSEISTLKDQEKAYNAVTEAIKRNVSEKLKEKFINEGVGDSSAKQAEALKMIRESLNKKYTSFADALKGEYNPTKESEAAFNAVKELLAKDDISGAGKLLFKEYGMNFMGDAGKGLEQYKNAAKEIKEVFKDADDLFAFDKPKEAISPPTYKEDYNKAKKDWEDAKKKLAEIEKDKSKFTSKQYEEAKKLKESTEKSYKDLGGITGSSLTKQENQADKLRKEQEKLNLLLNKQALDQSRSEQDLQNQVDQSRIDAMKDGSTKTIEQMQLNHKKEMQQFEREKEDRLRKAIEDARAIFDVEEDAKKAKNPKYIKGTFDASGVKLSNSDAKQYDTQKGFIGEKQKRETEEYYKSLRDSYQDYADQRIAIEEKFNADIATLQEARKKYDQEGNTEKVQQTDRAIAQATKDKGQGLMQLDYDKLKESPEYVRAFENLKQTSSETLNSLLSQLENAKHTAAKVLSPDQLREYTTTIQEIMDELDSRNPWQALSDKKQELADAEQELAQAQIELENARQTAETVKGGGKVEYTTTKFNQKTGKIDSTKAYLTEAQALDNVKDKTEKYNKSKDNVVDKNADVKKSEKDVADQIDGLSKAISDVGAAIGGPAGEIIGLIGDIGLFAMTAMSGVSTASETASKSIQAVEKASVILMIISAAIQLATKVADMFAADYSDYNESKENYEKYVEVLDMVIGKQKELIETLTGKEAVKASEDALRLIEKQAQAARNLGKERLNAGASAGSHSIGVRIKDGMSSSGWNEAKNALGVNDYNKIKDGRMTGLFDLSVEQLKKLQLEAPEFWAKLDDDVSEYLEQIIACNENAEEMKAILNETLTGVSFDSFREGFLETLSDMDSSSQDFAKSFEGYLQKAILNSLITEKYDNRISNLYKKWSAYSGDDEGLTPEEAEELKKEQQDIAKDALADRDSILKDFGLISGESSSQDSSKGGFQAMSQDTGEELNGRFTALQIAGEEAKNQSILQTQSLSILTVTSGEILSVGKEIRDIADETRTILANSYLELVQISENTEESAKYLKEIKSDIAEVKKNTKAMAG